MGLLRLGWLVLTLALGFAATATPGRAGGDLFIYNWTDYTAPAVIAKFEKETGIKVTVDTYDSNETLLAKLKSGGGGYDIVVVSSDFVPVFVKEGLIQRIDAATMPGYAGIDPRWRDPAFDRGNAYSIPYDWGITAFAVNTAHVQGPVDSLKTLFEPPPEARGKIGMLGAVSEVVSLAEVYLGLPPCQTDPAAIKTVFALLEKQAPSVKVYNSDGAIDREASGETWIHQIWNGDAARARANNPAVTFVFPKEGAVSWMDNLAVPTGAPHLDNAKAFLRFMLKPENSALSSNFTHYASAITGSEAYLDLALKTAPELNPPAGLKLTFVPACPEEAIKLMDRLWTRLRR
jgi:spermidine/putrescine transport system substrate-binding protein